MKRRVLKKRASRRHADLLKWHRRNMSCASCRFDYDEWLYAPLTAEEQEACERADIDAGEVWS